MITVISRLLIFFFSHNIKYTNSAFSSWILFSVASAHFQDFYPNQDHIAKISFWLLEIQGSTIDSIYRLVFLLRAPQDSIAFYVDYFFSSNIRTVK